MNARERQEAIYRAEGPVVASTRQFTSEADVIGFVVDVAEAEGVAVPAVSWAHGNTRPNQGQATAGEILLASPERSGPLSAAVVLHEIAHVLVGCGQGHSQLWLGRYLDLIRTHLGVEAWATLAFDLDAQGITGFLPQTA